MKRLPLIAIAVLAACVPAGAAAAGPRPAAYVLTLGELPPGFAVGLRHLVTNATAAGEDGRPLSLYERWGRVTGYEVDFDRAASLADGPVAIASIANVYRTARGAASSLAESRAVCAQAPFRPLPLRERIGDGAVLCGAATESGGVAMQDYAITWRRGELKLSVMTAGLRGRVGPGSAIRLAQKLDRRIRSHGAAATLPV